MSRMTQHERMPLLGRRPKRLTVQEALAKIKRKIKRQFIAEGHIVDPSKRLPRNRWYWSYGDQSDCVLADTRSQAKAIIKRALGLPKNHRLPAEVEIRGESTVANTP